MLPRTVFMFVYFDLLIDDCLCMRIEMLCNCTYQNHMIVLRIGFASVRVSWF